MNITLFVLYFLFIISLLSGIYVKKNTKKEDLYILHSRYELILFALLYIIFSFVNGVLIYTIFITNSTLFIVAFIMHILFNLYLILDMTKTLDTYTNQYNTIIYNFFTILIVYLCSLTVNQPLFNMYIILIMIYNIFEFQFATFNIKELHLIKNKTN